MTQSTREVPIRAVQQGKARELRDSLAAEEPLEIRLRLARPAGPEEMPLAVTMRTPGQDRELAAGFLFSEGIVRRASVLVRLESAGTAPACKTVLVTLGEGLEIDESQLQRHFYTTSSCGVCGKASLEALRIQGCERRPAGRPRIGPETVYALPARMSEAQSLFAATGGLHAAGLFDADGELLALHEDVGRHNALDKLVGAQLLDGRLPLEDKILLVSGRTSFEILQKALVAGIPMVAGISAPSSLAVGLAREFGVTLIGFLRGDRFNVYSDEGRLACSG